MNQAKNDMPIYDLSKKTKDILIKLKQHKNTYPQLTQLWEKTIHKYENNLTTVLKECENAIGILEKDKPTYDLQEICNALSIIHCVNTIVE